MHEGVRKGSVDPGIRLTGILFPGLEWRGLGGSKRSVEGKEQTKHYTTQ